ncbi:Tumor necrosis factor receptor super member, partial [Branchiostoma belcheri]
MDYRTWTILNVVIIVVIIPVVSTSPLWMDPKMCDKCPAGTYMEVACLPGQPDTPTCTLCPEGTFRRKPNHAKSCHPHKTSCDAPYQIKEPVQLGTRTHDAVCHCEHGTIKIHENKCVKRETCPPGKGSAKGGHCEHCKEGYFSDKLSKFQKCLPIRNCSREGKQTIIQGTRTSDALCGAIQTTRPQTWDSSKKNITNMTKQQEKESTSLKPMERTEKLDANFSDTATVVLVTASTALALSNMTVHKKRNEEEIVHDKNIPIDFHEDEDNVTEYLKDSLTPIPHLPLGNAEVANTPVTTIDIPVRINVILGFTCAGLIATFVVLAIGLLGLRHMREIMKKITKENTDEISQLMLEGPDGHERDDNGVNSAFNE